MHFDFISRVAVANEIQRVYYVLWIFDSYVGLCVRWSFIAVVWILSASFPKQIHALMAGSNDSFRVHFSTAFSFKTCARTYLIVGQYEARIGRRRSRCLAIAYVYLCLNICNTNSFLLLLYIIVWRWFRLRQFWCKTGHPLYGLRLFKELVMLAFSLLSIFFVNNKPWE